VTFFSTYDIASLVTEWGVSLVFDDNKIIHTLGFMHYLVFHLSPLMVSSPLSTIFIIGCYSKGHLRALFISGACEGRTSWWSLQYFIRVLPNLWPFPTPHVGWPRCINSLLLVDLFLFNSTHISLGQGSRVIFHTLGLVVISGRFPHYWQLECINFPWSIDCLKCLTSAPLFTLGRLY